MAGQITLHDANVLIQEPLKKGIIETIVKESAVLELLPFTAINGNSLAYIQETAEENVGFRAVNTEYEKSYQPHVQKTESLKRLGAMVEVDRFIELTQNIHDVRAEQTSAKSKAIANQFTKTFFKGKHSNDASEFDGLDNRIVPERMVYNGAGALDTKKLHELLDTVEGGADVLFMNKRTRREVTALFANQGAYIQSGQDAFGRPQQYFGDIRIAVVDDKYISDDSIYALKFGMDDGVVGIQAGSLQAIDNGLRGTMYQTLIEWYLSIVVGNPNGVARLVMADKPEEPAV